MTKTISSDPHLAETTCWECGQDIIVTFGSIRDVPSKVTGYPRMVPDLDLNSEREGWICESCAEEHYQNGDAAWGGDGSLIMMPSYYE